MVGGLGFQVLSLLLFIGLAVEFALNVRRDRRMGGLQGEAEDDMVLTTKSERTFKGFLLGSHSLSESLILPRYVC